MRSKHALRTRPLMPGFGVEILDVDVAQADAAMRAEIVALFRHHGAVLMRQQRLEPHAQVEFTNCFGPCEDNDRVEYVLPECPKIYVISNKIVNGRAIGEYDAGIGWHTDLSNWPRPALCTMLHALEVPPEGSDTLIADLCAVWKALPERQRRRLHGLRVHHSYIDALTKRGVPISDHMRAILPYDVFHPLVRRHADDGRESLWLSNPVKGIKGMSEPEGRALMQELIEFATQAQFVYRHKWTVGDILVWDDRCTLHSGTPFDKQKYVRLMHRTWVRGEVPIGADV